MSFWGSVIGAVSGFAGGRRDQDFTEDQIRIQQENRAQDIVIQDPVHRRWRLEEAGLNPGVNFAATGGTPGGIPMAAPVMGRAIADAGAMLASGFDQAENLRLENTRLELEKRRLDEALKREVIRPNVGGIYQQRRVNRANSEKSGGDTAGGVSADGVVSGQEFGDAVKPIAPGRELEVAPITSGPGITEINNTITGPIAVPGSDGEPWGADEVLTGVVFGVPQVLRNATPKDAHQELWGPFADEADAPTNIVGPWRDSFKTSDEIDKEKGKKAGRTSDNRPPFRRPGYRYPGVR